MPMATIRPAGETGLYHIHFLDPGHPDQGLPGMPPHVGNRPPGSYPGHPDQGLPGGWPGRPDQGLPGSGGRPDNTLPPPQIKPGYLLILARGQDGKWHYAALAPGSAPPKPLPEPPKPDQGPVDPEAPPAPDQTLPPIAAPV